MLIGVLSDTHIPYRAEGIPYKVLKAFERVDLIIHAGDICENSVLVELSQIAPVKAVVGNTDGIELRKRLPQREILVIHDFRIGVIHGDGGKRINTIQRVMSSFENDRVDCIIFGHTHKTYMSFHNSILLFNPGSPTDRRKGKYCSYGILSINDSISCNINYF